MLMEGKENGILVPVGDSEEMAKAMKTILQDENILEPIVATIGGLFLAAAIVALLGGGEDTPVLITIILWIVCGAGLSVWFDNVGF